MKEREVESLPRVDRDQHVLDNIIQEVGACSLLAGDGSDHRNTIGTNRIGAGRLWAAAIAAVGADQVLPSDRSPSGAGTRFRSLTA